MDGQHNTSKSNSQLQKLSSTGLVDLSLDDNVREAEKAAMRTVASNPLHTRPTNIAKEVTSGNQNLQNLAPNHSKDVEHQSIIIISDDDNGGRKHCDDSMTFISSYSTRKAIESKDSIHSFAGLDAPKMVPKNSRPRRASNNPDISNDQLVKRASRMSVGSSLVPPSETRGPASDKFVIPPSTVERLSHISIEHGNPIRSFTPEETPPVSAIRNHYSRFTLHETDSQDSLLEDEDISVGLIEPAKRKAISTE
jgi:hypothetical protein